MSNAFEGMFMVEGQEHLLTVYRRGFHGVLPKIWSRIPQEFVLLGQSAGRLKIKKRCTNHITNYSKCNHAAPVAAAVRTNVNSNLSIKAKPFKPLNVNMNLFVQHMQWKNDGILII